MVEVKKFRAKNVAILDVEGTNILNVDKDKEIRVKISDGNNQVIIDPVASTLVDLDFEHHEIHEGNSYWITHIGELVIKDGLISIAFKTSNTAKWNHMLPQFRASGEALFEILEAPIITAGTGSQASIFNRNRNSSNTSVMLDIANVPNKVTINSTITNDGTIIEQELVGAGKQAGGQSRNEDEVILKQNTLYAFRVTTSVGDNNMAIKLIWYEHINVS